MRTVPSQKANKPPWGNGPPQLPTVGGMTSSRCNLTPVGFDGRPTTAWAHEGMHGLQAIDPLEGSKLVEAGEDLKRPAAAGRVAADGVFRAIERQPLVAIVKIVHRQADLLEIVGRLRACG